MIRNVLVAAALAAPGLAAAAPTPVLPTADPALYWNDVALANIVPPPPPGPQRLGSAPVQTRGYAMVNIALHDAINATLGGPNNAYLTGVSAPGGNTRAAAAKAARDVLVALNPERQPQIDAAYAAAVDLIPDGAAKTNGIATGAAFAARIIADRAADGSTAVKPNPVSGKPDEWQPTPAAFAPAALQQWGDVKTFLMDDGKPGDLVDGDDFRPGPPPAPGTPEFAAALDEVRRLGAKTGSERNPDQTESAAFWNGANGSNWLRIAVDIAATQDLSPAESARLFARLTTALADTQIAGFDAKTHYDFFRPVTAMQAVDPTWEPLNFAPAHQSYVSTLSALSGAGSTILQAVFGDFGRFCTTIGALPERCWDSFAIAAEDAKNSRVWGGIHYSFDGVAGLELGRRIGQFALDARAFSAVPEPEAWAIMTLGFALVAGLARRRRNGTAAAVA